MMYKYNKQFETFVDGVIFTKDDPCIWITYRPGAMGDLWSSIIDKHYNNTGCRYYGINDNGQVILRSSDSKIVNAAGKFPKFNDDFFYLMSDALSKYNLNYSLLDNVIISSHLFRKDQIELVLNTFKQAKIINIYPADIEGLKLLRLLANIKNGWVIQKTESINNEEYIHDRVLNIPFCQWFTEESYEEVYSDIVKFLDLPGKLIRYDYIEYYLDQQINNLKELIQNYAKTLNNK